MKTIYVTKISLKAYHVLIDAGYRVVFVGEYR